MDERFSYCSLPQMPPSELPAGTDPARVEAILVNESKWVNHTVLHYYFFDRETDGEQVFLADGTKVWRPWTTDKAHQDVVRNAFDHWKAQGIGLEFAEVTSRDEAEIRIGFMEGDGAWSYLGRQILDRGVNERTMNFGWDLLASPGRPTPPCTRSATPSGCRTSTRTPTPASSGTRRRSTPVWAARRWSPRRAWTCSARWRAAMASETRPPR